MFNKKKFYKTTREGLRKKKLDEVNKMFGKEESKEKPRTIGKTASERKREKRVENRARRRAAKSGAKENSEQFNADVKAEKALIEKRRANRKRFLKDFATGLAGIEQNTVRGQINTKDVGFAPRSDAEKAQQAETSANEENIASRFKTISDNESLGDIGLS